MRCTICSKPSSTSLAKVNKCEDRFCDDCIESHINESLNCPKCDALIRIVIFSDGNYLDLEEEEEEEINTRKRLRE
jgi:hypothetical protein